MKQFWEDNKNWLPKWIIIMGFIALLAYIIFD
jgi:hypothetical protein